MFDSTRPKAPFEGARKGKQSVSLRYFDYDPGVLCRLWRLRRRDQPVSGQPMDTNFYRNNATR
ncbi:MAG: hypothetical protein ABSE16_19895 [Verrucomicrobiota bacterium]|jgi:hypothetical protein